MSGPHKVIYRRTDNSFTTTKEVVTNALEWLADNDRYQHFLMWYDNLDSIVFVLTDRDTALQLKLSLPR